MKTKNLTNLERSKISQILMLKSKNGKIKRGVMLEVADQFSVCRKSITRIWNQTKKQLDAGQTVNVNSKLKGKKCHTRQVFDVEKFNKIPLSERTTQHSTAEAYGTSQSAISRWVTDKTILSHTNAIKPQLNDKNKLERLLFSLGQLHYDEVCKQVKFNDQSIVIHMDEKWFYLTQPSRRFYLSKGEKKPYRSVQSKKFIGKVMFMCAVARPRYGSNGEVLFDGKIGIWPFIVEVPAKRNSRNRVAEEHVLQLRRPSSEYKQILNISRSAYFEDQSNLTAIHLAYNFKIQKLNEFKIPST
ncbi:uncharacterized protein LOC141651466 [Silene latifolia]|uniref:uncharacterized protein LOC141651466 n=1 Tax=Silene latifolia TaxID=37657 RepID=UPI003D776069